MKIIIITRLLSFVIMIALLMLSNNCNKQEEEKNEPVLTTSPLDEITATTATCGGDVTSDGGAKVTARGVCWSTAPYPTTEEDHTIDGTGTGSFTSSITGLTPNSLYYVRAYATNSQGTAYGHPLSFKTLPASAGIITDIDGNEYNTLIIGTQVWMAENLKVTKYRNGEPIPNVTDFLTWSTLTTGGYCNLSNNGTNGDIYGRLYNWYAVNDGRNIAPEGWHVATDADWTTLVSYLGGDQVAGGKLKETGTLHWCDPNTGATNNSGFTALPGGSRSWEYDFLMGCYWGCYWSSTVSNNSGEAYNRILFNDGTSINRVANNMKFGMSVRCVKDN